MSFSFSDSREIESAYIIRLSNNPISVEYSDRCKQSCDRVGMPAKFWEGFDGTSGNQVIFPDHLKNKDYFSWIKVHDNKITTSQIGCVLSHFSLWCHCLTIDRPIVILEHDAIMLNKLEVFSFYNMIQYLGSIEQVQGQPHYIIPLHGTAYGEKLKFIGRAHAYAIDPQVSKNLVTRFIQNGVFATTTADMFMRADIFPIVQRGIYAYDFWNSEKISTIEENPL
jgi:hypothetical protein